MLSIGASLQNLEYAANNLGYSCQFNLLATTNQDKNVMEVKLVKSIETSKYDIEKIKHRRTVRSNFLNDALKKEDVAYLMDGDRSIQSSKGIIVFWHVQRPTKNG